MDGTFQIFTRSSGSQAPTQVTRERRDALFPFWSPDGTRIFEIAPDGLYVVGATGGTPQLVLSGVSQAAIAPDGNTFAVLRQDKGAHHGKLFLGPLNALKAPPNGTLPDQPILPCSHPRSRPDGKQLAAWLSLGDGTSQLWTMSPEGTGAQRQLERLSESPLGREFLLRDSRRILFADRSGLSSGSHLWIGDLRTGILEPLTSGTSTELSPSADPSGRAVAFTSAVLDYDIVQIGFDGSMNRALATNRFELSPSNGPGGNLVWMTDQNGRPEIWLKHEGENWPRPITPDAFSDSRTTFLFDTALAPDGRRLAFRRSAPGDEAIWISTLTGDAPGSTGSVNWVARSSEGRAGRPTGMKSVTSAPARPRGAGTSAGRRRRRAGRHRRGGRHVPPLGAPRKSDRGPWTRERSVTVLAADGSDRRLLGSGHWIVHGWSADGTSLYGVRQSQKVEIVRLDVRSDRKLWSRRSQSMRLRSRWVPLSTTFPCAGSASRKTVQASIPPSSLQTPTSGLSSAKPPLHRITVKISRGERSLRDPLAAGVHPTPRRR